MRTIINVANRLPVTVGKTIEKSSGGLVSALEGVSQDTCRIKWLGWFRRETGSNPDPDTKQKRTLSIRIWPQGSLL